MKFTLSLMMLAAAAAGFPLDKAGSDLATRAGTPICNCYFNATYKNAEGVVLYSTDASTCNGGCNSVATEVSDGKITCKGCVAGCPAEPAELRWKDAVCI